MRIADPMGDAARLDALSNVVTVRSGQSVQAAVDAAVAAGATGANPYTVQDYTNGAYMPAEGVRVVRMLEQAAPAGMGGYAISTVFRVPGSGADAFTQTAPATGRGSMTLWTIPKGTKTFRAVFGNIRDRAQPGLVTPNPIYVKAALAVGADVYPLTFGEDLGDISRIGMIEPGKITATSALAIDIPAGTTVEVRCWVYGALIDDLVPCADQQALSSVMTIDLPYADDYVDDATAHAATGGVTKCPRPLCVIGTFADPAQVSVAMIGDSLTARWNYSDFVNTSALGYAIGDPTIPRLMCGLSGADEAIYMQSPLLKLVEGHPIVICALGRNIANDVNDSLASVQARFVAVWARLKASGSAVYQMYLSPSTTGRTVTITSSTDASPRVFTAAATHGLAVGDSIVIAGHDNTAANGQWIVDTIGTGGTVLEFTVKNAAGILGNVGDAGAGGTLTRWKAADQAGSTSATTARDTALNAWFLTQVTAGIIDGTFNWAAEVAVVNGIHQVWADYLTSDGVHPDFAGKCGESGRILMARGIDVTKLGLAVPARYNTVPIGSLAHVTRVYAATPVDDASGTPLTVTQANTTMVADAAAGNVRQFTRASSPLMTIAGVNLADTAHTFLLWIKASLPPGENWFILNSPDCVAGGYMNRIYLVGAGADFFVRFRAGGADAQLAGVTPTAWNLVAFTLSTTGAFARGYVPGVGSIDVPLSGSIALAGAQRLYVGTDHNGANFGTFELGDVWVVPRVMALREIDFWYELTKARYGL